MNLADNLKKIRKEHNLSQEQLAEQLNVSRQSVSKWESNQAYPEMDKMVQLCKLFNLNIDDLLNQDISEVNNNKQVKNSINKFIDDFLKYVTKTIDLFSMMKFKTKIKCLFEQFIIIGILILIFLIIGTIASDITYSILSFLPDTIFYSLYNLFEGVYLIACLVLGIALVFHIFKVRYLDYYEVVNDDKNKVDSNNGIEVDKKDTINRMVDIKKEKIIIRDPKHSEYKFINGILKILIFIMKIFAIFIGMLFSLLLCILFFALILSFAIIKTGLLFIGILLTLISFIAINYLILRIIYNFVFNSKSKKMLLFFIFIISLIGIGVGIGLITLGITKFDYVEESISNAIVSNTETIEMNKDLVFINWYSNQINYIESDNNDIKIEYVHNKYYDIYLYEYCKNAYAINYSVKNNLIMDYIRTIISDINAKKIVDYEDFIINVYTTKENIEIIRNNYVKCFDN